MTARVLIEDPQHPIHFCNPGHPCSTCPDPLPVPSALSVYMLSWPPPAGPLQVSSDERHLFTIANDLVKIVDLDTGAQIRTLEGVSLSPPNPPPPQLSL